VERPRAAARAARRDSDRRLAGGDPIRDDRCRAQPRAAVAIDRHPGYGLSKPGVERRIACDVVAGGALREPAAHDHVLDLRGIDAGALDRMPHHVRRHRDAVSLIESAPSGTRDARPAIRHDRDVLHEPTPSWHTCVIISIRSPLSGGLDTPPPRWDDAHGREGSLDRFGRAPIAPSEAVGSRDDQVLGYAREKLVAAGFS